jgi:transposase
MTEPIIGIDVLKAKLDAAHLPDGQLRQFSNDSKGHKALWQWIEQTGTELVVFEATGACHRQLERFLDERGQGYARSIQVRHANLPGRAQVPARRALHARAHRRPVQPRSEAELPAPREGRKTTQGRHHHNHETIHHIRKCNTAR